LPRKLTGARSANAADWNAMFHRLTLPSILLLATIAGLAPRFAWAQGASRQDAGHKEMLKLLPDPLPAGAVMQGGVGFYIPDSLYQYMDGGADIFLLYGFRTLMHEDLKAGAVDVTVDVFDMGSPEAAFGMYAAERSPAYNFIAIGAEGYRNTGILNFLEDRYYVKLAGFGDGADSVLDALAHAISARIGGNPALPALLAMLPQEHRKPHSEQYMPNDPLGHPFLGPAFVVAYATGDHESKLFVTVARDETDARQRLKQLEEHFAKTGECKRAPEIADRAIRGSNSFEGSMVAQTKGRYLLLLLNPAAESEQILKSAADSLK
jgi:hypothetical protein